MDNDTTLVVDTNDSSILSKMHQTLRHQIISKDVNDRVAVCHEIVPDNVAIDAKSNPRHLALTKNIFADRYTRHTVDTVTTSNLNTDIANDINTDLASNINTAITITMQTAPLAIEAAVAIVINGIHYAILMASPLQLEYLALGFLFSEGLVDKANELLDWEVRDLNNLEDLEVYANELAMVMPNIDEQLAGQKSIPIEPDKSELDRQTETILSSLRQQMQDYDVYVIELRLNQRCHQRIMAQKRQLAGRTGCGMCGITGLSQALPILQPFKHMTAMPSLIALLEMRQLLETAQQAHQLTGSVHAAAAIIKGEIVVFEDVGRHNALDKLIGYVLRHQLQPTCVLMTSRLSIELVQKAIRLRLPWLIGISAPTSTAVSVAKRYGLGLGGFLRDNRVTYYSGIDEKPHDMASANLD